MSPVAAPPPAAPATLHASVIEQSAPQGWQAHTVQAGETVYDLALRYDTTVAVIVARNDLPAGGHLILPGTTVEVPRSRAVSSPSTVTRPQASGSAAARDAKTPVRGASSVTVTPGDTLWSIAARLQVSVASLVKANNLSRPGVIHPGQVLTVRTAPSSSPVTGTSAEHSTSAGGSTPANGSTHTVRAGETMWAIAARHGIPVTDLLRANPGVEAHLLAVGQQVLIPRQGADAATRPWTAETIGTGMSHAPIPDTFLHYTYPSSVARSAAANREHLAAAPVPNRVQTRRLITSIATRHGVDHRLALAIAWQESGWNQRAVSPANAIGIMQVIPSSGEWASLLVGRELNLLDPRDNITAGVVILRALMRAAGDEDQVIAGYYQGLAGVQRHGMYPDTRTYVEAVTALRSRM